MKIIITERQYKLIKEQLWGGLEYFPETGQEVTGLFGPQNNNMTRKETPKTFVEKSSISIQITAKKATLKTLISSKKKTTDFCLTNSRIKKPSAYTGEIQDFLVSVGLLKTKDYDFKNLSATAAGSFLYGKKSGINTVGKLYDKLKSEGYNVGPKTVSVFTNQMASGLSKKISDKIDSVKTWCEKSKKEIDSNISKLKREIKNLESEMTKPNVKYGGYFDQTF